MALHGTHEEAGSVGQGGHGLTGIGSENTAKREPGEASAGDPAQGADARAPGAAKMDPTSLEATKQTLSPQARAVIDAVMHKGGHGPIFDADQLRMAGLLVSPDLGSDQIREVISMLRSPSSNARTPDEAIIAIDRAVRAVRNKNQTMTVTVDGVASADSAPTPNIDGAVLTGEGPITSPDQLDAKQDDAYAIVHETRPAVIGRWFRAEDRSLVLTEQGAAWRAGHRGERIGGERLVEFDYQVSGEGEGHWDLQLRFKLKAAGASGHGATRTVEHRFLVERGRASSLGAQVGELAFEPYVLLSGN